VSIRAKIEKRWTPIKNTMQVQTVDHAVLWLTESEVNRLGTLRDMVEVLGDIGEETTPLLDDRATLYNLRTLLQASTDVMPVATPREACDLLSLAHYLGDELGQAVMAHWIMFFGAKGLFHAFEYLPDSALVQLALTIRPNEILQVYQALNHSHVFDETITKVMKGHRAVLDIGVNQFMSGALSARADHFGFQLQLRRVLDTDLSSEEFRRMLLNLSLQRVVFHRLHSQRLPPFNSKVVKLHACRIPSIDYVYPETSVLYITSGCEASLSELSRAFPNARSVGFFTLGYLSFHESMRHVKRAYIVVTLRRMELPRNIEEVYVVSHCSVTAHVSGSGLKRVFTFSPLTSSENVEIVMLDSQNKLEELFEQSSK
jgi:hypothetical protein